MFSQFVSITKSLNAKFKNYSLNVEKLDWKECPENSPIVGIDIGKSKLRSSKYLLNSRKSSRGRKKKVKKEKKKFPSTINFIIRKEIIREKTSDSYSYTSIYLEDEKEKIFKDYNIFLFNKGKIICVGIKEDDCSDFHWCINIVREFLVQKGLNEKDLEIIDIKITLENYRFNLVNPESRIDLYKLNNYHSEKFLRGEVISFDILRFYEFLAESMLDQKFKIDKEKIYTNFIENEKKHFLISKVIFDEFLDKVDLFDIYNEMKIKFGFISKSQTRYLSVQAEKNLEKNLLYCFIKIRCEELIEKLDTLKYEVVESLNFNEEKNTLLIVKRVFHNIVVLRIFNSGKIVVVGSESKEEIFYLQEELSKIFDKFVYNIDYFPLLSIEKIMGKEY